MILPSLNWASCERRLNGTVNQVRPAVFLNLRMLLYWLRTVRANEFDKTDELLHTVGESVNACNTRIIQWNPDCLITVLMCLVVSVKSKVIPVFSI
jgi:hypothetical protein